MRTFKFSNLVLIKKKVALTKIFVVTECVIEIYKKKMIIL